MILILLSQLKGFNTTAAVWYVLFNSEQNTYKLNFSSILPPKSSFKQFKKWIDVFSACSIPISVNDVSL